LVKLDRAWKRSRRAELGKIDYEGKALICAQNLAAAVSTKSRAQNSRPMPAGAHDWLEKLGMSEYAQSFEHKIDISVAGHLTDQDLKDIGIPLGHRRKILRLSVSLPALPRRYPNLLPDRSRTHRTLPSAVKSRCRQTPQMVQSTTGS